MVWGTKQGILPGCVTRWQHNLTPDGSTTCHQVAAHLATRWQKIMPPGGSTSCHYMAANHDTRWQHILPLHGSKSCHQVAAHLVTTWQQIMPPGGSTSCKQMAANHATRWQHTLQTDGSTFCHQVAAHRGSSPSSLGDHALFPTYLCKAKEQAYSTSYLQCFIYLCVEQGPAVWARRVCLQPGCDVPRTDGVWLCIHTTW